MATVFVYFSHYLQLKYKVAKNENKKLLKQKKKILGAVQKLPAK